MVELQVRTKRSNPPMLCQSLTHENTLNTLTEKRMKFLQRLVLEIRALCPPPFCLSVKLNSGDYMASGGLSADEALSQVHWLITSGHIDFVEISGGTEELRATQQLRRQISQRSAQDQREHAHPRSLFHRVRRESREDRGEEMSAAA